MMPAGRALGILLLIAAGLVLVDRLGLWAESRGWIYWRRRRSSSGATAFESLSEILVTGAPRYAEEKEAQSGLVVEAEDAAPPSPEGRADPQPGPMPDEGAGG